MGATWSKPGFFKLLRTVFFWASAVFFLVHPLTQCCAEQTLEFLRELGVQRRTCARHGSQDNSGCCAIAFNGKVTHFASLWIFQGDFWSPRWPTVVGRRGLGDAGVAGSFAPK